MSRLTVFFSNRIENTPRLIKPELVFFPGSFLHRRRGAQPSTNPGHRREQNPHLHSPARRRDQEIRAVQLPESQRSTRLPRKCFTSVTPRHLEKSSELLDTESIAQNQPRLPTITPSKKPVETNLFIQSSQNVFRQQLPGRTCGLNPLPWN